MPGISVNDAGTVKAVTGMHVNAAGTVKPVLEGWVNDAGTVKKFWPAIGAPGTSVLSVTTSTSNSITLAWTAAVANGSPVTDYEISWGTDGVTFPNTKTVGVVTTDTVTGLATATTYYFRIRANSALGFAPYSNIAQGATQAAALPQAPTVTTGGSSTSSVNIRITAGGGGVPTSYIVEWAYNTTGGNTDPTVWNNFGTFAYTGSPQTIPVTGLRSADCFAFRVRAVNGAGTSANSALAWGTTIGNVAYGSIYCGTDPEDTGTFKDTGYGSNSAASGNAGQSFGNNYVGDVGGITLARFARSGSTTMAVWLEGASVPSDLFTRISFGDGRYSYSAAVSPQAAPGGGPQGTLWVSSWSAPSSAIGQWLDGAYVTVNIGK